jgi:hypothetical protein
LSKSISQFLSSYPFLLLCSKQSANSNFSPVIFYTLGSFLEVTGWLDLLFSVMSSFSF